MEKKCICKNCKNCKNCKEIKHQEIVREFKESGCKLLSEPSLSYKMKYECSCGTIGFKFWSHFKNGERCRKCGIEKCKKNNSKRLKVEKEVYEYFEKHSCKLLEAKYVNSETKMKFLCNCGNECYITWDKFKIGKRCKTCNRKKYDERKMRSGNNHPNWNPNRDEVNMKKKVRQKAKHILRRTLLDVMKSETTFKMLGYTKEDLINHIINHKNWALVKNDNWELDHYFPVSAFFDYNIHDIKIINMLENLQPLSKTENRKKNNKYNKFEFEKWLQSRKILSIQATPLYAT